MTDTTAGMAEGSRLLVSGPLTIENIAAQWEALLAGWAGKGAVTIDAAGVDACDTAGLQLLLSAKRSAEEAGRVFSISNLAGCIGEASRAIGLDIAIFNR